MSKRIVQYARGDVIFTQGDPCAHVLYIQSGGVKLSVVSKHGREAVLALLGPGHFFGEGCLAGQPVRTGSATAVAPSAIVCVGKNSIIRLLHTERAMCDWFISHLLAWNVRIQEDLIDQIFNTGEKRLARALLLLAGYGQQGRPVQIVPNVSPDALARMIGATTSQVNVLLKRFNKHAFIEYSGELPLKVNSALLNVVLQD